MNQRRPLPDARVRLRQRIGDAERNTTADQLAQHFTAGRITNEEFDHRLGKVMTARTTEDLWRQLSDLPHVPPPPKTSAPLEMPERRWGGVDTMALVTVFLTVMVATPIMLGSGFDFAVMSFMVGTLSAIGGSAFTLILSRHHNRAVERRSRQLRELGRGRGGSSSRPSSLH